MSLHSNIRFRTVALWMAAGLTVIAAAWIVPVNLKSVTPALLKAAGVGTLTVVRLGRELLDSEKSGPAALALAATRSLGDPQADALAKALDRVAQRRPELVPWGGWDPFLDPLINLKNNSGHRESTPVLTFFITEKARTALRDYLVNSRSDGVQSLLRLRALDRTGRFVSAHQPGGQALDAVILLGALLYQGEHLTKPLQRELRGLAETAMEQKNLGELEPVCIDLLSLGRRLNWLQLCEIMRVTDSTKAVGEFAQLVRATPDDLPLVYSAALLSGSADRVTAYLMLYGRNGMADMKLALSLGEGALNQLLLRQVPVNRHPVPSFGPATLLALLYPKLALATKYLGFLLGAFFIFRGLDRMLFDPRLDAATHAHVKSGVLAILTAGMLVLATEPFLLKSAPPSEFQFKLTVPVLANISDPTSLTHVENTFTMDTSTLLSIGFFALLQVGMYLLCLAKMREIDLQNIPALLKLRLMENEENLFDGGLYIGIAGTATALVLQVLKVIEPNLLAAYSSNLFGIICVALVKIRHVRPFKRRLILESQTS